MRYCSQVKKEKNHTEVLIVLLVENQTIWIKMTLKFLDALPEEYPPAEAIKQMVINETYFMGTI